MTILVSADSVAANVNTAHSRVTSAAYDRALMRQFMALFSTSPIALLLGGYFSYIGVPIADEEGKPLIVLEDDPFDTIIVSTILSRLPLMYLTSFVRMPFRLLPPPSLQAGSWLIYI